MRERHVHAGIWFLLASLTYMAPGCQPASDLPRDTAPAASSEPPPPPPPLPTETEPHSNATADSPAPSSIAADTAIAPPPPPPAQLPPPAAPIADCRMPTIPMTPAQQRLRIYFTCGEEVRPVERVVAPTRAVLRSALEQLLRGPAPEERAAGFTSFFGDATANALNSVVVRDGVAHVDFANFSRAIPNASSSAGSAQLLEQLRATIFQYSSIRSAEITFDGSCDAFWNWLQRGCMTLTR